MYKLKQVECVTSQEYFCLCICENKGWHKEMLLLLITKRKEEVFLHVLMLHVSNKLKEEVFLYVLRKLNFKRNKRLKNRTF